MRYFLKYILALAMIFISNRGLCDEYLKETFTNKIIKTINCGAKVLQITDITDNNEVNSIKNSIHGIFYNKWLAYTESTYYGEHHNYYLVNMHTCDKFDVDGENFDFLNKNIFLTWSWDFEAEYYPNQISTYEIIGDKIQKSGEFSPIKGGPSKAKWINPRTIEFTLVTFNESPESDKEPYNYESATIININNEWLVK